MDDTSIVKHGLDENNPEPVTYFVDMLRGADFLDLIPQTISPSICCVVILTMSILRFRKTIA